MIISQAVEAFKAKDYIKSIELYRKALATYPFWKDLIAPHVQHLEKRWAIRTFGYSYDADVKKVPDRPPEFPADLVLPPLKGVANDYSFIDDLIKKNEASGNIPQVNISVVVPVYNRKRELDFVLAGLTHQTYPLQLLEVIVADDGSHVDMGDVIAKYSAKLKIKHVKQEDKGYRLSKVRNLGIANAKHDHIIILDGDAIPEPTLVKEYAKVFAVTAHVAVMGLRHYVDVSAVDVAKFAKQPSTVYSLQAVKSENQVATKVDANGCSVDWRQEHFINTNLLKDEALPYRFLVGANCGFSKALWAKVGGYCEEFEAWGFEDQEFAYRLLLQGAYFKPLMNAYVYHQEPVGGKNDTDRKLGEAITKEIFIQKCPFIYRERIKEHRDYEVPLVSIYVPLYNREKYIVECVQSALNQTVKDLEVVVCDDGSTDRSVEMLNKHFAGDPRVRVIKRKNGGISAASNTALNHCRGYYIGQLDADDVLKLDAVEQCLKVMRANTRLSLVYGTTEYIDENSNFISKGWNWPVFSREYLLTRMICHHFRFFRRRDWARTSGFDESMKNAVDYDMMLKLAEVGEVVHLNKVLYEYRKHGNATTATHNALQTANNFKCINSALTRLGVKNYVVSNDDKKGIERAVKFNLSSVS